MFCNFLLQTGECVKWHDGPAGYCAGQATLWWECHCRILLNDVLWQLGQNEGEKRGYTCGGGESLRYRIFCASQLALAYGMGIQTVRHSQEQKTSLRHHVVTSSTSVGVFKRKHLNSWMCKSGWIVEISVLRRGHCLRTCLLGKALRVYSLGIKGTFNASSGWSATFKCGKDVSFSKALC
jgi:hypothetical protein